MSSFTNRLAKLEHAHGIGTEQHKGWLQFIWDGPKDDARLEATRLEAEASGMGLITLRIVDPKEQPAHVE